MRRAVRFLIVLARRPRRCSSSVGYVVLTRTIASWFESDLALRSRLAVAAARQSLASNWAAIARGCAATLADITRDERIMGAAACSPTGELLAATEAYPAEFSCRSVLERMRHEAPADATSWSMTRRAAVGPRPPQRHAARRRRRSAARRRRPGPRPELPGAPRGDDAQPAPARVLRPVARRLGRHAPRGALRLAGLDARAAARAHRRAPTREFQPLARRPRARRAPRQRARARGARRRLEPGAAARDADAAPARRAHRHPRQPRAVHPRADGRRASACVHPASGLVTALEPVMRACSGVWVAHGSGTADRETVDAQDRVRVPPGEESYVAPPRLADRGGGERLLLRLLERGALAALPRRARAARLPRRGLGALRHA